MLVGLQLTSTEIVLSTLCTKPVIIPVDSPSQSSDAVSDVHSISASDDNMMYGSGRAHKRDCFRRRRLPQSPGESRPDTAHSPPLLLVCVLNQNVLYQPPSHRGS